SAELLEDHHNAIVEAGPLDKHLGRHMTPCPRLRAHSSAQAFDRCEVPLLYAPTTSPDSNPARNYLRKLPVTT
ncbi:hypothetical protein, partial [Nocardia sp. NPDC051981]|uniref:hypothetical protein n=1 Tax=Nocardia sp. NPDC051981 TaxID=3155417 RepID=UPI00343CA800